MLKTKQLKNVFFIICTFFSLNSAYTFESDALLIKKMYQSLPKDLKINQKIVWFSQQFINAPYTLGPLGEGDKGKYDESPLYRMDSFDCQTYVETVMALALAKNLTQFEKQINEIRYKGHTPNYLTRNHFMSLNWLPNNSKKGYIKDITNTLVAQNNKTVFNVAKATINKNVWLSKKTTHDIKIKNNALKKKRLKQLKNSAKDYPPQQAKINYVSLTTLFDKNKSANPNLFKQIPNGSIINIVRPNWQLEKLIGTNLNVSHLGFAIKKQNQLYFREASSIEKKVIDVPLIDYLKKYLDSPTVKGINILIVLKPHT